MFHQIFSNYQSLEPAKVTAIQKPDCLRVECSKYGLVRCIDRVVNSRPLETKSERQAERDKLISSIVQWVASEQLHEQAPEQPALETKTKK